MNGMLSRREFVQCTLGGLAASLRPAGACASDVAGAGAGGAQIIIDTHTHFYDPTRPQGVPWPPKDNPTLYRTVLPSHYVALPKPAPVAGTVVVEASGWVEDNQWILDLAAREPFIRGFVGNLSVGTTEFAGLLKRFSANPVFRGVRVQGARLGSGLGEARFLSDLKALAGRDLSLDVVGSPAMLPEVARLAREIPDLRIIIDHVAGARIDGAKPPEDWLRGMEAVARCANVGCKVSGLVEGSGKTGGQAPRALEHYRSVLDAIWECFGEARLIYGSNWPVCELYADLATVQRLASEYFEAKGAAVAAKVFAGNAQRFYGLKERGKT
jgi:L-fuconolactonase